MILAISIIIPIVFVAGLVALLVHLYKAQHKEADEYTDHTLENLLKGDDDNKWK